MSRIRSASRLSASSSPGFATRAEYENCEGEVEVTVSLTGLERPGFREKRETLPLAEGEEKNVEFLFSFSELDLEQRLRRNCVAMAA